MYNTSKLYKGKILENNRVFKLDIRIEHSKGTLKLTDKDIAQNTLVFEDATQSGDEFTVGGTFASNIDFTLVNKSEYENISFTGAKVYVNIGLLVREAIDAHFIQPTQPSKMVDFDDLWEYVPLGEFNIDDVNRLRSTIEIRAIDNMILLDKSYEHSNLAYPATLNEIFLDICQKADVTPGTTSFVNDNYSVPEPPKEKDNLSFRNILGYLAEISGSYAKFNREGHLELRWYEETDLVLTPDQRSSFKDKDYEVQITGVVFDTEEEFENEEGETEREEVRYMSGTDEYAINLSDNELLQDDYDTLLPNILNRIDKVKFTPTEGEFNGNPAIESGDIITHEDIDGNIINTVVTHSSYKYRGRHTIKGEGKHNLSRDFKSTDNRIAHIIDRVEENLGDEINNLEQAQLNATELIANTLGGFITEIRVEADPDYDRFGIGKFVHDAPQLRDSTKIWKWGLGGFGYSDDGGETYTTAITKDGSIVANLITANMVQTGVLRGLNNKTVMDLDNGTFRLGNEMIFDGETLNMGGNTSISWGNITDNSHIPSRGEIPTKPSDIGAKDDGWYPTWSQVSGKPRVYSSSEIKSYATTITKNTITTPFINALDITAKHLESGTIRIGGRNNDAFRVSTNGTLYGANGNFKVAHNGDGVYNSYANTSSSSDTSPAAARWKRSDGNYFYQDLNEARIYMGGRSRFRLRERDGISGNWALTIGGSDGATIKAIDDAIQIRNYTDARYAPISASDFKLADGTSIAKTYSLLGQPATISSDKLDVIKNTKIYEEPQNIIDNDKKITLLNHSENMDMKFANIPKEISNNGEISMINTIGVLWKAVQELSAEVDELKGVK